MPLWVLATWPSSGREIFVGIRKGGTNVEGALVVGRAFPDLAVVPVQISGSSAWPLKHYVSVAAENVLAVGKSKEAQDVLKVNPVDVQENGGGGRYL